MPKTLIIGGTGRVGRILVPRLVPEGVGVLVRDRNAADLPSGVELVEGDVEGEFEAAMQPCERVVFTAGSGARTGFDKTLLVDLWGAKRVIDAAERLGVAQFIMVSSRGADDPELGPRAIKPYLVAKYFADEYLMCSRVPYTILRPGRLVDDPGTGRVTTRRPSDPGQQRISREDTAAAIEHCLAEPASTRGRVFELYAGDRPLVEALAGPEV